jgi:hypothetical protein
VTPLAIDLFCGLGGWTDGLLAEGYDVIGFDIERHRYPARAIPSSADGVKIQTEGVDFNNPKVGSSTNRSFNYANECLVRDAPLTGGWIEYPGELVIQDVCTLHGSQFKDAALIVASPPCQEYSYMAMPWTLAKEKAKAIRADTTGEKLAALNRLFHQCFRIQKEASFAAGRHIPLVVENVRGAQPWVGRARWNFGSFYLWGDVPALMPMTLRAAKVPGFRFDGSGGSFQSASVQEHSGVKNPGLNWSAHADPDYRTSGKDACFRDSAGRKQGGDWFAEARKGGEGGTSASFGSKSPQRKMASAMIAKIPLPLSRHIAATFR